MVPAMPDRAIPVDDATIAAAARHLRAGDLVVFPTETVYGLGADATNATAVARVFDLKGRPAINPLIVHLADVATAAPLAASSETAERLAAAFWPGPLTLVVPRPEATPIADAVSAGLPTLAIRVPGHPVARRLLHATGRPIAAPSANPSGRVSPTRPDHVDPAIVAGVAMVVDAGPCERGLESTVIDTTGPIPRLLRPGTITAADVRDVLGLDVAVAEPGDRPAAPGMLLRHYAPATPLRLNVTTPNPDEAFLAFGPTTANPDQPTRNLSPSGDLREAAANLYHCLHTLDRAACRAIAVAPIPDTGLGEVINERLARAAAGSG